MNRAAARDDSAGLGEGRIDKAFVIQNLFARLSKMPAADEIFFNYSLDSDLSPERRTRLAQPVDDHLQDIDKYGLFLTGVKLLLAGATAF